MKTKSPERRFHEATAKDKKDCWHEWYWVSGGGWQCRCGFDLYGNKNYTYVLDKPKPSNPTYKHADEILNRMKGFLGEEGYCKFFYWLAREHFNKHYITRLAQQARLYNFTDAYILNAPALLEKALEFLEVRK